MTGLIDFIVLLSFRRKFQLIQILIELVGEDYLNPPNDHSQAMHRT